MKMRALLSSIVGLVLTAASVVAAAQPALKIGAVFPLAGHLAWLGEYYEKAAQLQVDMINEAGGVNGRKLELVVYDSKSSPEGAARAAQRLISRDQVVAIIGTASVPVSGALATVVNERKIPTVLNSGYLVEPAKDPFVFNSAHKTSFAVDRPFQYFADKGLRRVALLMPLGPLGDLGISAAKQAAERHGLKLVGTERFNPQSPDLTAQLARVRATTPQAVFSFVTGEPAAMVARNMQQIRLDVPLLVSHGNATPGFLRMVQGLATDLVVPSGKLSVPGAVSQDDPIYPVVSTFNARHQKRYGEPANYFSGLAGDAVLLVAEGLRRAGSTDGEAVRAAMESIQGMPGYGGVFNMSAQDHHGTTAKDMVVLRPTTSGWTRID